MKKSLFPLLPIAMAVGFIGCAQAASEIDVDASFNPYKNGVPTVPGLTPGMTINKGNVEKFKDLLDPSTYALVSQGSLEFPIEQTNSIALHPNYIAATKKN